MDAQSWTYPASGITYEVPDNTSIIPDTSSGGWAQIFDTRQQFQNYFSGKAGVKASYGGFSAQFNIAYSSTFHTDTSYYYGLFDADFTGWGLAVADQSPSWVSSSFLNDPDVQNLPTSFTPENQEQFFAVFRKFGTHFVGQVTLGGSLYYYLAVEKSYTQNETQVEANVSLEYKAVFVSSKATASAEWQTLGQTWADSRIVTVSATGGDASVLSALDPGYGDSDVDIFNAWSSAVIQNPAAVGYQLRPLNLLFSGDTAAAVQAALQVYTNGAVIASGNCDYTPGRGPAGGDFTTSSSITVNGTATLPSPQVTPPAVRFRKPRLPRQWLSGRAARSQDVRSHHEPRLLSDLRCVERGCKSDLCGHDDGH
jgi:hypothetical protein